MKKHFLTLTSLLILASVSFADEATIVSISADEIRADAHLLDDRQIVSSGQPDQEILSVAKDAGFVAVIDLRTESEDRGIDEPASVEALGMSYVSLPVAGAEGTNFDNAKKLDEVLSQYDGPVLLHCGSGNRVGALLALRASLNGASDEEAMAIGKLGGITRLEGRVTELLAEE